MCYFWWKEYYRGMHIKIESVKGRRNRPRYKSKPLQSGGALLLAEILQVVENKFKNCASHASISMPVFSKYCTVTFYYVGTRFSY